MIITIISPIKFKEYYLQAYIDLSLQGNLVFLPVDLADNPPRVKMACDDTEEDIRDSDLMRLHKEKIDESEQVVVVRVDGYMGRGTYEEIGYATTKNIPVRYVDYEGRKK